MYDYLPLANRNQQEALPKRLSPGDDSSLVSLAQMAIELKKTPSEALSRLMAKEFLRRKGGGAFFCEGDR